MSFILDALKKSESERQERSGADFSSIPAGSTAPRRNTWLWATGLLLAVNLAVLLGILLRSGPEPATPAAAPLASGITETAAPAAADPPRATAAPVADDSFRARVASAREGRAVLPAAETERAAEDDRPPAAGADAAVAAPPETRAERPPPAAGIPTIDELRLDGRLDLPQLRIDLHVYSEDPAGRFVFINMKKYRERARLAEGPVVREIRGDGVALEYNGQVFLLPRE